MGSHKTGTTSIQYNLEHNSDALAAHGLTFFRDLRAPEDEIAPDLHSWLAFVDRDNIVPSGMKVREPNRLIELLAATKGDVVVSAENFSFFFDEEQIHGLYSLLTQVFSEIDVICYLRRQDRHVISHHQEGSKTRRRAEYELYGHSTRAIPPWTPSHDLYLDYHRRLSMWADAFGRDSIKVRVFDRSRLHDGDAVADFFALLGVSSFQRVSDRNQSVGRELAKVGHLINGTPLTHRELISTLVGDLVATSERALPSRQEARDYYERFAAGNAELQDWALPADEALFDDDFDEYDTQPLDLWDEDSANAVMTSLLKAIDTMALRTDLMVDRLRDAAVEVGDSAPEVAVELLRLAAEMRPGGPLIQRRLREFEQLASERPPD